MSLDVEIEKLEQLASDEDLIDDLYEKSVKLLKEDYPYLSKLIDKEIDILFKSLKKVRRNVGFALEVIPIPFYKFTKRPLIKWSDVQKLDSNNIQTLKLRHVCSRLGNLLNYAYVLHNFVVIDIDIVYPKVEKLSDYIKIRKFIQEKKREILEKCGNIFDIETRRGFQKIFYLKNGYALATLYKRSDSKAIVFWTNINLPESFCKLEIRTGGRFLAIYPEASHYLDVENGKLVAKKWKVISNSARQFVYANIVDTLEASVDEIRDFILKVLECLDINVYKSLSKVLEFKAVNKEEYFNYIEKFKLPEKNNNSKNINYTIATLDFKEFISILRRIKNKLPNCVYKIFFEGVKSGYCYFMGRLLCTFLFKLVKPTVENVEEVSNYFVDLFESFKKPRTYYYYYYCFSLCPNLYNIGYPTTFNIGQDVYEVVREYSKCDECKYRDVCYLYNKYVKGVDRGLKIEDIILELMKSFVK